MRAQRVFRVRGSTLPLPHALIFRIEEPLTPPLARKSGAREREAVACPYKINRLRSEFFARSPTCFCT